jgi:hypothetical protein
MTPSSARARDIRTQGLASVTQDMSSARLKILGDLMDSRKRAEQHEQEFLKTIHSENAAFSRIVSLFEESIEELRDRTSESSNSLESRLVELQQEVLKTREELESRLQSDVVHVKQTLDKLESSSASTSSHFSAQVDSVHAKLMAFISSSDFKNKEDKTRLEDLEKSAQSLSTEISNVSKETASLRSELSGINSIISEQIDGKISSFQAEIESLREEFKKSVESRVCETERTLRGLLESRLGGLEEQLGNQIREGHEIMVNSVNSRVESISKEIGESISHDFSEQSMLIAKQLSETEERLPQFVLKTNIDSVIDDRVKAIGPKDEVIRATADRVASLEEKLVKMTSELENKISRQSEIMNAIAHSGFRYEWNITNAISRFTSLGLLGSGGKYVSSESFNIGPYKNLSIRFFPLSTVTGEVPTVWLINRPANADAIIPVYVDIGVGLSKRGPLKRKQVQELFGHWVWEATFPSDVLTSELRGDDLVVSVEISMRQWMELDQVPQVASHEETIDVPESPSAMSTFTFVPVHASNPFDAKREEGSVTPRRSSWAQFGSPDENEPQNTTTTSRLASNPFK